MLKMKMRFNHLWTLACLGLLQIQEFSQAFQLTLLHTNDVHARIAQFNKYGASCSDKDATAGKCFGGVARRMTKVREIRKSHDNVLLLDAGDQFLGTLWFTHYKGLAASQFMREIGYDAMCLGNHEFDLGIDGLMTFLDNVTFPVVSANIDATEEPRLQSKIAASHVFTVSGEKVGVIGYLTQETIYISNVGKVLISDVLESVKAEVTQLSNNGVNKIIALGHAGYEMDKQVATLDGVDVVIGGHTNTFLYKGQIPSREEAAGEYPTVVTRPSGSKGLVVQAFTWGKYLGYLNVTFDAAGEITEYSGNPILLDSTVAQDNSTQQEVHEWSVPITQTEKEKVGNTNVLLDGNRQSCRLAECNLGNFVTDALVDYYLGYPHENNSWAPASVAIWNGGGIRASFEKGTVTLGDVLTAFPFSNEVDLIELKGRNLRQQLEVSARDWDPLDPKGGFLQMSGLRVVYNMSKPVGTRVTSVQVRCLNCEIPSYSPLIDDSVYSIFTSKFLISGGDGYDFDPIRQERFNSLYSTVMAEYFKKHSPVYAELQGRIKFLTDNDTSSAISSKCSICLLAFMIVLRLFLLF